MTVLGRIFHTGCERTTTPQRAARGLAAGAATGAGLVGAALLVMSLPMGGGAVFIGLVGFLYGLIIWAAGLLVIGAPGWWVLHRLGARCQQAAMIFGGFATFAVVGVCLWGPVLFMGARLGDSGWLLAAYHAAISAIGVAVAWVIAQIAYRPAASLIAA